jgi:lactoylglutathione lyase
MIRDCGYDGAYELMRSRQIQAACQRIEDAGYKFQKKLTDGRMRHIAFALDPDNYWVEVVPQKPLEETENVKETDVSTYRMVYNTQMLKCYVPKC